MKTSSLFLFITATIMFGCSKKENAVLSPETSCRLSKASLISSGGGYTSYTSNSVIEYNPQGQMFRSTEESKMIDATGGEKNVKTTSIYDYDSEGFVKGEKQNATDDDPKRTETSSLSSQFKYNGDRLSEEMSTTIFDYYYKGTGLTESYTYSKTVNYEYDGSGKLTRLTELTNSTRGGNSTSRYYYSGGKLSRVTYQIGNGPEEDDYTVTDGKIVQRKSGGDATIYKYDSQDRLVRTEYWNAGKLTSFIEQNYDNQIAPLETSPQLFFKGWPKQKTIRGEYGNTSNNIINMRQTSVESGASVELASYAFQYEFNKKGIPVKAKLMGTVQGKPYSAEYVYEYIDCD
ncbi:hypothetical protein [Dyadobacter sp. CY312]|uniref:hypothetical protein n=1 Tax=Dyadobacter sp. CY312 TaxID=2907303 RepID=UPI001F41668D|nr:hypothetical protein [Dyadobacter sp. CY312]MCE7042038.1 hypothetical protein [Dyadobacter sp. CY312]